MSLLRVIHAKDYRRAVWKNGLGHTDEIAIYPDGSDLKTGNFLWRLSSARIERASPFSAFPHHDRTLVILNGAGVHLTHTFDEGEDVAEVAPFAPYEFPGDIPSRCDLIDGGVQDLSVFVRKAEAESVTETLSLGEGVTQAWIPAGRFNFIYAASGNVHVESGSEQTMLREGETLRVDLAEPLEESRGIRLTGSGSDAELVVIAIQA